MRRIKKIKLVLVSIALIMALFGGIFCLNPDYVRAQTNTSSTSPSTSATSSTSSDSTFLDSLDFTSGIKPIAQTLKDTNTNIFKNIKTVWTRIINLLNSLIIGLLIFVAICQILRINVNTYGVKKMLPSLLLAVIAANFSFLICRLLIDLSNIAMSAFLTIGGAKKLDILSDLAGPDGPTWAQPSNFSLSPDNFGDVFWFNVVQYIVLAIAILFIILAFLFFIRIWLVYFLVAISPVAFMAIVLPQTKTYFNQWWSNFTKWVFMPVVSIMFIWLANLWMDAAKGTWFMSIAFTMICLYLAITVPFKLGGAVMGKWAGYSKAAWNKTGGKALGAAWNSTGGAAVNVGKDFVGYKYGLAKQRSKEWTKNNVPIVKQASDAIERGKIKRDLADRKTKKLEDNRTERAFMQVVGSKSMAEWEKDPILYSRIKTKAADIITGEYGENYKNEMSNEALTDKLRYIRDAQGNLQIANLHDFTNNPSSILDKNGVNANIKPGEENVAFKEHAASAKELSRRQRQSSLNKSDGTANNRTPEELMDDYWIPKKLDYRIMRSGSAVGNSNDEEMIPEIIKDKAELEKSIFDGMEKDIEEQIDATKHIIESGHTTSNDRAGLRQKLNGIEQLMDRDVNAAADELKKSLGINILGLSPQDKKEEVQKTIDKTRRGIGHMDIQAAEAKAMGKDLDDLVAQGFDTYKEQMSQHMKSQAMVNSKAQASAVVASQSLASNPALHGLTAGQLANSDLALNTLADHMSELNANIGRLGSVGNLGDQKSATINPEDAKLWKQMAKEGMAGGLNAVHSEDPGASLAKALNSVTFQNKLGETMKRSVELGNKRSAQTSQPTKVKVTNPNATNNPNTTTIINNNQTTQTPPAQRPPTQTPPPPVPPNRDDFHNPTH